MRPLWIHRPVVNWKEVYQWASEAGLRKLLPPQELHATLLTCRQPVDWTGLELEGDEILVPEGHKTVQIFGYMAKAIAFGHPRISARHAQLASQFPTMDHADILRPHVTLMRGGRMPRVPYLGRLVLGPEVAQEFNERAVREISHVRVQDVLEDLV